jgi:hypothetical protein
MSWEKVGRAGPYYCRTRRVGGRCTRQYFGKGVLAEIAAEYDAQARARRVAEREALRAEQQRCAAPEQALARLRMSCRLMSEASFLAMGFYQHDRGSWRPRRGRCTEV